MILWTPILRSDSRTTAQEATRFLQDPRAEHFWDLWRFANRTYAKQFSTPIEESWDLFVVYAPQMMWNNALPNPPTAWFQHRNLKIGEPYTQAKLKAALERLID